ncbi:MAG: bifunctional oligoribonuclease/PAP phosphatase NrnA [Candidatus Omnitrophica bacterium]|nr:bifunctional oligoribonuclease/PAP phosphatase NrnA [Candidatus Omnitrophota bacterium]
MKPILARDLEKATECIQRSRKVLVASHINPDGDTIGSLLALGLGLERLNKEVIMVSQDGVPERYKSLPGADRVLTSYEEGVDLAISVDCGALELLGTTQKAFARSKKILQIDHHDVGNRFGDYLLIDSSLAAAGEEVYHLLNALGVEIDLTIAKCLLTSLVVETSSFRLPNVTDRTFHMCAELLNKGVDFSNFVQEVFWKKDVTAFRLFGLSLSRVILDCEGRLAWSVLRQEDFAELGGKESDVDDVADAIRTIEGVWVTAFFREQEDGTLRVSLRSRGEIDVATIAQKFGGGGHYDTAGCKIEKGGDRAIAMVLSEVASQLKKGGSVPSS